MRYSRASLVDSEESDSGSADTVTRGRVCVAIAAYNQARYLADAIASVLAQTVAADEVIVVDDGSTDNPAAVVEHFPGVILIRQENAGLSAARNTGLLAAHADYVIFLDADDLLLPCAIEAALDCFARAPNSAFVYGGFRLVDQGGAPISRDHFRAVGEDAYASALERNFISMHAAVTYRREILLELRGFDTSLRRCEDYDMYLRVTQQHPVACFATTVAEYRRHTTNMSLDYRGMFDAVMQVMQRHEASASQRPAWRAAWEKGVRKWHDSMSGMALSVARSALMRRDMSKAIQALGFVARTSPSYLPRKLFLKLRRSAKQSPFAPSLKLLRLWLRGRPLGPIWLGGIGRTEPVDGSFGSGRGTPVDRYYIENFLAARRTDIRGRVLEVGDRAYTTRFGGEAVSRSDVLHVHSANPEATIVGDLSQSGTLPLSAFDCMVITQTLQYIFDIAATVHELAAGLKPGGVALVTLPYITQVDRGELDKWFWSITPAAAKRLFSDVFGPENVEVSSFGNVYATTVFLQGLALEEVDHRKLDVIDPAYPMLVTVRAVKPDA